MSKKKYLKKGQVVLFVIIVLTISIIIVSSLVDRSLLSRKNTDLSTDSTRAFNAAEAGIDELLSRSDLTSIASGTTLQTKSVDRNYFSQANYTVTNANPGYFGLVDKDSLLQVEFNANPTNLTVYFEPTACLAVTLYVNTVASPNLYNTTHYYVCGATASLPIENGMALDSCAPSSQGLTMCKILGYAYNLKILTVRVLESQSKIEFTAGNMNSFSTKALVANSVAQTRSGVKKEIQVETKTTKDIYPVFDHTLFIR